MFHLCQVAVEVGGGEVCVFLRIFLREAVHSLAFLLLQLRTVACVHTVVFAPSNPRQIYPPARLMQVLFMVVW